MRSRRASRVLAAVAAVLLAASSVGASVYPRTPAAKDCCKKRCGHDTPSLRGCCCALPASPAASGSVPEAKPVSFVSMPGPAPVMVHAATPAACSLTAHAPPGCPLFLQRCTLVL